MESGNVKLEGKAWAGKNQIAKVEISIDGGKWEETMLHEPVGIKAFLRYCNHLGKYAWRSWSFHWHALPGKRTIQVRATDDKGNAQPDTTWNFGGFAGNMIQQVEVNVLGAEELQEGKKLKVSEHSE